jgi:1-acyl-sn-glycerol-3-phosphate acyltransferase
MREWNYENDQWTKLPYYLKHLPLFTRHFDLMSAFLRFLWGNLLRQLIFRFYIRLSVKGDFHKVYREHTRLILISNHASHLDAVSIAAAIPQRYWLMLYIAAAKDYFFSNFLFTFFSKHCLGAIPIDRKDRKGEAVQLIMNLLKSLSHMWLIIFPEGTRSKDGLIHPFKRGVSLFSQQTDTPILFLFVEGNAKLMPKGSLPRPGKLILHVGPVQPPAPIEIVYKNYRAWVESISDAQFAPEPISMKGNWHASQKDFT